MIKSPRKFYYLYILIFYWCRGLTNFKINEEEEKGVVDVGILDMVYRDLGINIETIREQRKILENLDLNFKKTDKGPLHLWRCIACDRTFKKPLYSHRECPYCKSDLIVIIDISEI